MKKHSRYRVTICTPVWVFGIAAPVKQFCAQAAGHVPACRYVLVHYQKLTYRSLIREMDQLLGVQHESAETVCCRRGRKLSEKIVTEAKPA